MKIRTRLALWYAAILFTSLLIIGAGTYREISEQLQKQHPRRTWRHALDEAGEMVFQVGLPAILLGIAGGWWLTRKTLAPIQKLTSAAEAIHEDNLQSRISRSGNGDELDRLTEVFNAMTSRLEGSFTRIREFTLHASHELKTPLTVLRGQLESALENPGWSPSQKEFLHGQIDEIERLAVIVDGLTLLTRANAGQVRLNMENLRLDELVRENAADAHILAQPRSITVELGECPPAPVSGDRHRLRQLLLNLTDNAVKYNVSGGRVSLSLTANASEVIFRIANSGPGLPGELRHRVFEPFFRGEPSHSRDVEGCGLGLSICQWIVTAHNGSIQFESVPDTETVVTVRLPSANPQK